MVCNSNTGHISEGHSNLWENESILFQVIALRYTASYSVTTHFGTFAGTYLKSLVTCEPNMVLAPRQARKNCSRREALLKHGGDRATKWKQSNRISPTFSFSRQRYGERMKVEEQDKVIFAGYEHKKTLLTVRQKLDFSQIILIPLLILTLNWTRNVRGPSGGFKWEVGIVI